MDILEHGSATAPDKGVDSAFVDVYERLKAMASRHRVRGGGSQTLCTTELVHEAYLRMDDSKFKFLEPAQFFAYAARAMRHILTDAVRRRAQPKRGGDQVRLDLDHPAVGALEVDSNLALAVDEALLCLADEFPRAAQVVELHFFAGLQMQRIAELLGLDRRTVHRDWRYAKAFLAARTDA
jgi:RNA polymerase sigma factor (TIGR02999 family)